MLGIEILPGKALWVEHSLGLGRFQVLDFCVSFDCTKDGDTCYVQQILGSLAFLVHAISCLRTYTGFFE